MQSFFQVESNWQDERRAKLGSGYLSATYRQESPCDTCQNVRRCAAETLACSAFVSWYRSPFDDWRELTRVPSRVAFNAVEGEAPLQLRRL